MSSTDVTAPVTLSVVTLPIMWNIGMKGCSERGWQVFVAAAADGDVDDTNMRVMSMKPCANLLLHVSHRHVWCKLCQEATGTAVFSGSVSLRDTVK